MKMSGEDTGQDFTSANDDNLNGESGCVYTKKANRESIDRMLVSC